MSANVLMQASVRAVQPYYAHMNRQIPEAPMEALTDKTARAILRDLGSVLAERTPCKTLKHVHRMCYAVIPPLRATLRGLFNEQDLQGSPEYLQLVLELNIPANLVKLMALALRAGYPLVPLPESAEATSKVAAYVWTSGADLFRCLIGLCPTDTSSPHCIQSSAMVEQLAIGSEGEEPGKVPGDACHHTDDMTAYGSPTVLQHGQKLSDICLGRKRSLRLCPFFQIWWWRSTQLFSLLANAFSDDG
jgi:hypothetical protein